ncbi:MAG: SDR family oxidoreductase [Bacteroidota bacterium]
MSKTVLVTGTSTGFGKLTVKTLAKEGYTVIAGMRGTKDKNAAVAAELSGIPGVEVAELDVTNDASVNSAVADIIAKHGQIDVLVNNAGVYGGGVLEAFSVQQVHNLLDVNLYGVLRLNNAVLPGMRSRREGLIINISSGLGLFSLPNSVPYNISKFALEGLTEGQSAELAPFGIETVSIQPGAYPTEIFGKAGVSADREHITEAYGDHAKQVSEKIGAAMFAGFDKHKSDPQAIADGVLHLIKTPKGQRPLRLPLDAAGQGFDKEFVEVSKTARHNWLNAGGLLA